MKRHHIIYVAFFLSLFLNGWFSTDKYFLQKKKGKMCPCSTLEANLSDTLQSCIEEQEKQYMELEMYRNELFKVKMEYLGLKSNFYYIQSEYLKQTK